MSSLRANAIGNLGNDAEVRYTQDGTPIVSFNVATSPYVKKGDQPRTNWVKCSYFGTRAQSVQPYLLKGKQVHVRGDLDVREWQANDGTTRFSLELRVSELDLLGSKNDGDAQPQPRGQARAQQPADDLEDENVPF